jgi:hypothetical protein
MRNVQTMTGQDLKLRKRYQNSNLMAYVFATYYLWGQSILDEYSVQKHVNLWKAQTPFDPSTSCQMLRVNK